MRQAVVGKRYIETSVILLLMGTENSMCRMVKLLQFPSLIMGHYVPTSLP